MRFHDLRKQRFGANGKETLSLASHIQQAQRRLQKLAAHAATPIIPWAPPQLEKFVVNDGKE
jgi:hypothetical protein